MADRLNTGLGRTRIDALVPGAEMFVTHSIADDVLRATVPAIGLTFEMPSYFGVREIMERAVDEITRALWRRLLHPLRACRHDRGWPKVATNG